MEDTIETRTEQMLERFRSELRSPQSEWTEPTVEPQTAIEHRDLATEQLLLLDDDIRDLAEIAVHEGDTPDLGSGFAYTQPEVAPLALPSTEAIEGIWSEARMRGRKRNWAWALEHGELEDGARRYMTRWLAEARRGMVYTEYQLRGERRSRTWERVDGEWTVPDDTYETPTLKQWLDPLTVRLAKERDGRLANNRMSPTLDEWLGHQHQPGRTDADAFASEPYMVEWEPEFDPVLDDARGKHAAAVHHAHAVTAMVEWLTDYEAPDGRLGDPSDWLDLRPERKRREWPELRTYEGEAARIRMESYSRMIEWRRSVELTDEMVEWFYTPRREKIRPQLESEGLRRWAAAVRRDLEVCIPISEGLCLDGLYKPSSQDTRVGLSDRNRADQRRSRAQRPSEAPKQASDGSVEEYLARLRAERNRLPRREKGRWIVGSPS